MTLSFMALLVIPALKLSDRGLFDGGEVRIHAAGRVVACPLRPGYTGHRRRAASDSRSQLAVERADRFS